MNYLKHYDLLIKKAQNRPIPDGYVEKHHILPKSMGGSDEKENLVYLTAREHFVAHFLLAKHYGENQWFAIWRMQYYQSKYYLNSKLFEIARKYAAEQKSKEMKSNNPNNFDGVKEKQKINNAMKNPIHRKKWNELMTGDNHPRRKNPEKWAHLKGVKRNIITPTGKDHHNARAVKCIETGEVFDTITMASQWLKNKGKNGETGNIVTGIQKKKIRYGYHWEYVD